MKIEIYSDIACPWCYVGERRLERALAAFPGGDRVEVVFRPYQLDPTAPEQAVPMAEHLQRKFGSRAASMQQHVAGAARGEGIEMHFERGVVVNTLTAHRLLRLAEHEFGAATQRALAEQLFQAYFERGADVSDPEVLTGLAAAAGMDRARVRDYLRTGEGREETRAEVAAALELGVRAVPTFVFDGRNAVEGAQPVSALVRVLEELSAASAEAAGEDAGGPACVDGACSP